MNQPEISNLLALARKVQTNEGVKKYNAPIGSVITPDDSDEAKDPDITLERMKSLQRQVRLARRTGNTALLKKAEKEFLDNLRIFAEGRPASDVIRELNDTGAMPTKTRLGEKIE